MVTHATPTFADPERSLQTRTLSEMMTTMTMMRTWQWFLLLCLPSVMWWWSFFGEIWIDLRPLELVEKRATDSRAHYCNTATAKENRINKLDGCLTTNLQDCDTIISENSNQDTRFLWQCLVIQITIDFSQGMITQLYAKVHRKIVLL